MTAFTRIGSNLWDWEPWTSLHPEAQILWLALYTAAEARRIIPGLWHGSITAMSEASRRPLDETMKSLDRLLDVEMVEFDQKHRVLRMTQLPDAAEYPSSPTILESWWSRFCLVPMCQVRDAHVSLVRWILDRGAATAKKNRSKRPTTLHEEIWSATFGTVPIPAQRRRGMRRLLDADTGTDVQPSLFGSHSIPSPQPPIPVREIALPISSENKDLRYFDTHSSGYGEGEGVGVGVLGAESEPDLDAAASENANRPRPALALVPPCHPEPFTPESLLAEVSRGLTAGGAPRLTTVRETLREELRYTIRVLDQRGWGVEQARTAGRWLASSHGQQARMGISPGCPPDEVVCVWASDPHRVVAAIVAMQSIDREGAERRAFLASLTGTGPP